MIMMMVFRFRFWSGGCFLFRARTTAEFEDRPRFVGGDGGGRGGVEEGVFWW